MSDLKLFRIKGGVEEVPATSVKVEKSLQELVERNLETLLGVRFLVSEYWTGPVHRGRIDTLGIDEDNSPVIVEYKRASNENVINQGLYYLDWLLDHKAEFLLLVQKRFGPDAAESIEWTSPRLICIAGEYTKYDIYAVQQINRQIELIRYRKYGDDLLLLELVSAPRTGEGEASGMEGPPSVSTTQYKTFEDNLRQADQALVDVYTAFQDMMLAMGDDLQIKRLKYYEAYKRIRNIACVIIQPQVRNLLVMVPLNPDEVELIPGFTRDVRKIGHWGTGDLEITIRTMDDLERARPLLERAYSGS